MMRMTLKIKRGGNLGLHLKRAGAYRDDSNGVVFLNFTENYIKATQLHSLLIFPFWSKVKFRTYAFRSLELYFALFPEEFLVYML